MTHAYSWGQVEGKDMSFYCSECNVSYSQRVMEEGDKCVFCKKEVKMMAKKCAKGKKGGKK